MSTSKIVFIGLSSSHLQVVMKVTYCRDQVFCNIVVSVPNCNKVISEIICQRTMINNEPESINKIHGILYFRLSQPQTQTKTPRGTTRFEISLQFWPSVT